jgi:hypothetical protein
MDRKYSQKMFSFPLVKPFGPIYNGMQPAHVEGASLLSAMFRRGGRQAFITSPARRRVFAATRVVRV